MNLECIPVGVLDTNCYLLQDGDELVIIDPGADADKIVSALRGRKPKAILLTHRHWDHISAVPDLLKQFCAPLYASSKDAGAICDSSENGNRSELAFMRKYLPGACEIKKIDVCLKEGDKVDVGNLELRVIETPGHSAGSICFYCESEKIMFTGDTIFAGGSCGRCDFESGSTADMEHTLAIKFVNIGDDVAIYPGHGPHSCFGNERSANFQLH